MKLLASILLLVFPLCIHANEHLKNSFDNLNYRYEVCSSSNKRVAPKIAWFDELGNEEKKVSLLILNDMAVSRCVEREFKEYTYQLFLESINTNNPDRLMTWFKFNQRNYSDDYLKIYEKIPKKKLDDISKTDDYSTPFDVLKTYESILESN
ncbi:conserved exported hypothetical protein [Vibrio aestuarianus]|nr:conserved exported hypothetical protein [Vibrio aestuarianus]